MSKKYLKILIVFLSFIILFVVFYFFNKNLYKIERVTNQNVLISQNIINVSLEVLGKSYQSSVPERSSVYDFMTILRNKKENNFSFKSKEYPSLGIFIDEINGVSGGNGGYWIYYINNKEATVGVSNYILKNGDRILWKQE